MEQPPILPLLTPGELRELAYAKSLLENPGLTARLAQILGSPIEKGVQDAPGQLVGTGAKGHTRRIESSSGRRDCDHREKEFHPKFRAISQVIGGRLRGVGGVFGLASLPVELPVSTAIMLRSIADIARSEGHDIS